MEICECFSPIHSYQQRRVSVMVHARHSRDFALTWSFVSGCRFLNSDAYEGVLRSPMQVWERCAWMHGFFGLNMLSSWFSMYSNCSHQIESYFILNPAKFYSNDFLPKRKWVTPKEIKCQRKLLCKSITVKTGNSYDLQEIRMTLSISNTCK